MVIRVTTIGDLLDGQAERTSGVALVMPGVRLTYPELADLSDQHAACLLGLGIRPGDKVGVLLPNTVDFVAALIGIAKLGAVSVPINGRFKAHELGHVISHAELTVLLTGADPHGTDYPALLTQVYPEIAGAPTSGTEVLDALRLRHVVDLTGTAPGFLTRSQFERAGDGVSRAEVKTLQSRVKVRDIALLMYTSGTTSTPKGCLLTHEALTRQAENVARTRFFLTEQDSFWDPLPLYHCGGIVPMLGCFSVGAKYCHPGHFEAGAALLMMTREHCTVLYPSFEAIWLAVLGHPNFSSTDLSRVRIIQNIATPERMVQFQNRMPWAQQVTSYGSTECATNLTLSLPDDSLEVRTRTLGRPVEGMEVLICDPDTGVALPPGQMGELCFRGYSSFEGYFRDPEQTARAFDADRWFHTGDRAMIDPAGNLVYGGRLKDMLKVGGENVAAVEIEDYIARHPAVAIVQVVAAPDDRYGEVPVAFVQLAPGAVVSGPELIEFCLGSIANYKVPRYVRFVAEWPMSGTKVQKYALRERIAQELAAAGITEAPKPAGRPTVHSTDRSVDCTEPVGPMTGIHLG